MIKKKSSSRKAPHAGTRRARSSKAQTDDSVVVAVRMPRKDAEALTQLAKKDGRTRNGLCAKHLREKAANAR
ncbi:MAG: hypothetical protein WBD78_01740 [Methylocella sp.]